MTATDFGTIKALALKDAEGLKERDATYGSSWRKRGGVGAFMMLARKWDRIENLTKNDDWDIFVTGANNTGDILDDIADLRRYLLLVEEYIRAHKPQIDPLPHPLMNSFPRQGAEMRGEATRAYVGQDPGELPPSWYPRGGAPGKG